ncbi:MAG: hypothetical protein SNJ74_00805 [Fimbriimonadaceae bacterium]
MRAFFRAFGPLVVLACVAAAAAQTVGGESARAQPRPGASAGDGPVTRSEARAVFTRLDEVVRRVIVRKPGVGVSSIPAGAAPVTRSEVVREMNRLVDLVQEQIVFTPRPIPFDREPITIRETDPQRAALEKLIRWGFVGRVAPLATSNEPTMSIQVFGDALAIFVARLCEVTHTPNAKFSPWMMRE